MSELVLTPSQTSGPLFGFSLLFDGCDQATEPGPSAVRIEGTVLDGKGAPYGFPRGLVEMWHGKQWARARTDLDGSFRLVLDRPDPSTTSDGQLLAPFFNVAVFGVGLLKHFVTRLYLPDEEEANKNDAVLQLVPEEERKKLIATPSSDGALRFVIVLQGPDETPSFGW